MGRLWQVREVGDTGKYFSHWSLFDADFFVTLRNYLEEGGKYAVSLDSIRRGGGSRFRLQAHEEAPLRVSRRRVRVFFRRVSAFLYRLYVSRDYFFIIIIIIIIIIYSLILGYVGVIFT